MKKILNALFLTLLAVFTFSSCSDVPAPYDILDGSELPGLTGEGTKDNPYDVAAAQQKQDGSVAWVQGYIVGVMESEYDENNNFTGNVANFVAPFTANTSLLVAASPEETSSKNCVAIQLPAGDVRTALNLKDHPDNLGKVVMIQGELTKYCGLSGVKTVTAAVLDGVAIGDAGTDEPAGSLAEKLDASNPVNQIVNTFDDAATDVDYVKEGYVNFAEVGGRTWRGKPFNNDGLIQATAYGSKEASVISWFVTPAVEVAKMEVKKLSFSCISAYYVEGNNLEVYFLEKSGAELTQTLLNVGTLPQNTSGYSDPATLTADLSAFDGKIGFIGFKYVGGGTATGTYQIDNLYVGVEPGEVVEPDPTPTPSEENAIFTETFGTLVSSNTNVSAFTGWDNQNLTFAVADTKCNIRAKAHATDANRTETAKVNSIWFPANNDHSFTISGIDASKYSKFVVKYELGANVYNAGSSIDLNVLKVALDDVEGTAASKIVSKDNNDTNVFFDMEVELNVQGTANSTLKFSATGAENTMGLLLYNVRLIGVEDGSTVEPEPTPEPEPELNKYESNITMPSANDSKQYYYYTCTVNNYPALKLGKSKTPGSWTSEVLGGIKTKLSFYAVGWTGQSTNLVIEIVDGGTFEDGETSKTVSLTANTGFAGSGTDFTIEPVEGDYHEYALKDMTANSKIKFATDKERGAVFGVQLK